MTKRLTAWFSLRRQACLASLEALQTDLTGPGILGFFGNQMKIVLLVKRPGGIKPGESGEISPRVTLFTQKGIGPTHQRLAQSLTAQLCRDDKPTQMHTSAGGINGVQRQAANQTIGVVISGQKQIAAALKAGKNSPSPAATPASN